MILFNAKLGQHCLEKLRVVNFAQRIGTLAGGSVSPVLAVRCAVWLSALRCAFPCSFCPSPCVTVTEARINAAAQRHSRAQQHHTQNELTDNGNRGGQGGTAQHTTSAHAAACVCIGRCPRRRQSTSSVGIVAPPPPRLAMPPRPQPMRPIATGRPDNGAAQGNTQPAASAAATAAPLLHPHAASSSSVSPMTPLGTSPFSLFTDSGAPRSPFHIFGSQLRQQLAFGAVVLGVLLLLLLLYKPQTQEGMLCGSRQAARARAGRYDRSHARSFPEVRAIQERQQEATQAHLDKIKDLVADLPVEELGTEASPAGPHILPLPPPKPLSSWDRKEYVPPAPEGGPWGKSSDYPGAPSADRVAADKRRWESEFQNLLNARGGNVMSAFHDFIARGVDPLEVRAAPLHTVDQSVAVLDGRQDPMVIFIIKHTFHLLGPGWGLVIFCTSDNEGWFIDQLKIRKGEAGEHIQLQRVHPIHKGQANSLPMSTVFHERVGVETVLLVQPDAFMLRSPWLDGPSSSREAWNSLMSQWGYIGAPWGWCHDDWCKWGGNGGASLRKRSVMRDVCSELRCGDWECHRHDLFRDMDRHGDAWWRTEDTFVAKVLHQHQHRWRGRLPDQRQSAEFAQEHLQVDDVSPFFVHKIWNYQPQSRWLPIIAHVKQYCQGTNNTRNSHSRARAAMQTTATH